MGKLKYYVIHCAETYPETIVTKEVLDEWHKGPRNNPDGTVTYLGKVYPNRFQLPRDILNGKPILNIQGRGWDRYGYSDIFHREGFVENITPYDEDEIITNTEMTWGQTGINSESRHVVLEGGLLHNKKVPFNGAEVLLYSSMQLDALTRDIMIVTTHHPGILIAGHYQFNKDKTCPNFNVPMFLKNINRAQFAYKPK